MLEKIPDLPPGIDGLRATGKLSREDYESVFEPLLNAARRDERHLRFLYQFGPGFEGFTAGGVWEDARLGLQSMRLFDGCAIVTDTAWVRDSVAVARFLMPCPVRMFAQQDIALAVEWLEGLPHGSTSSHRLLPEDGVIIFEVREALRATDFDALAATADAWIETRGQLNGLVVHARHFPGWENALGMTRHMRFVKDHHCRIARIALVADSKLMEWAPRLGAHFVAAEVTTFGYDELDQAVAWASGRERGATSPPPLR